MGSWAFVCKARGMKTLPSLCVLGGRRGMGQGILGPVTGNEMLYKEETRHRKPKFKSFPKPKM